MPWFNNNYLFRRNLSITTLDTAPTGQVISFNLSTAKMRTDGTDVVAVYVDSTQATPVQTALPTGTTITAGSSAAVVNFNLLEPVYTTVPFTNYYIYYDNPNLTNAAEPGSYMINDFPITVYGADIAFTKPGIWWNNGITKQPNAIASFNFYGQAVAITANTGPDYGIASVKIDNQQWYPVDLYSQSPASNQVVWSALNLDDNFHHLQFKCTGTQNPKATSTQINISSIKYSQFLVVQDLGEEVLDTIVWIPVTSGGAS